MAEHDPTVPLRRMFPARLLTKLSELASRQFRGRVMLDVVDGVAVSSEITAKDFYDKRGENVTAR